MTEEHRKFKDERLCYRDEQGSLQTYKPGEAPVVWVPDQISPESQDGDTSHNASPVPENTTLDEPDVTPDPDADEDNTDTHSQKTSKEKITKYKTQHAFEPEVKLPRKRRKDFMPDEFTFKHIDEHAMKAPAVVKDDLARLVEYLTSVCETSMEQIRAFYIWITHNINYDTSGYIGRSSLQPRDPETVLVNRVTVCEGYVRLMEAFCRKVQIPVKNICGYAKAFGFKPGNDVTTDIHNAHAWNAVFIDGDWLLLDVTWGAGFVKTKEKRYVPMFNNAYFLTDPDIFVTDHLPAAVQGFPDFESSKDWQLLDTPINKLEFAYVLNFDKSGKEYGIQAVSHKKCVIYDLKYETDIVLEETYVEMLDYVAFLYEDDRKLDTCVYSHMLTERRVNVHVCFPKKAMFALQIYGRRVKDGPRSDFQPIVKYYLHCTEAYKVHWPYPFHHTLYGPSRDIQQYGVEQVDDIYNEAELGEVILAVKPLRHLDILPRLYFHNSHIDLKEHCFVDYSENFEYINIIVRLRYEGYFKLMLFAKKENSSTLTPFMTHLIKSTKACFDGLFPHTHEYAIIYKCCILEPLTKCLSPNTNVSICLKSPTITKLKFDGKHIEKVDDVTFVGVFMAPAYSTKVSLEGCDDKGVFHALYTYDIQLIGNTF